MSINLKNLKNKKPCFYTEFFGVDLAGLEPASSGANTDMLTSYTTGPDPQSYYKTKEALLQELLLFSTRFISCSVNRLSVLIK